MFITFSSYRLYLLAILVLFLLSSCGDDSEPTPTPLPPPTPTIAATPTSEPATPTTAPAAQAESPLAPPAADTQPLSPMPLPSSSGATRSFIMFNSSQDGQMSWVSISPEGEERTDLSFQQLPAGLRINELKWEPTFGLFLARLSDSQQFSDYYLLNLDGSIYARITNDTFEEGFAQYSPTAKEFIYICMENDLDICAGTGGSNPPRNLTNSKAREAPPYWNSAGTQIIFTSDQDGIANVWRVNVDGSDRVNLSAKSLGTDLMEETNPAWSPDGKQIAYESMRDGNLEIYVMDQDGGNPTKLTDNEASDEQPEWSPDGKFILFSSARDNGYDLFVVDPVSKETRNLTNSPAIRERNYIWSADSSFIVFDAPNENQSDIFKVNVADGNVTNLTNSPSYDVDPQWIQLP